MQLSLSQVDTEVTALLAFVFKSELILALFLPLSSPSKRFKSTSAGPGASECRARPEVARVRPGPLGRAAVPRWSRHGARPSLSPKSPARRHRGDGHPRPTNSRINAAMSADAVFNNLRHKPPKKERREVKRRCLPVKRTATLYRPKVF